MGKIFLNYTVKIRKHKMIFALVTLSAIYSNTNTFWEGTFVFCIFLKPYTICIQSTQVQSVSGGLPDDSRR